MLRAETVEMGQAVKANSNLDLMAYNVFFRRFYMFITNQHYIFLGTIWEMDTDLCKYEF